ncbi:heterokaryon incompatibility protein-domain-containing protein [Rhexocercosporidium sp. MPI-PUGE-AT-0058]|nr:heterokaryon incompatibility protein-domain-containing protein [Rhexocercosporidium sp. MPI-PUGE-AT-0058]
MSFCLPCQSFGAWILTKDVEDVIRHYRNPHLDLWEAIDQVREDPRLKFQHHPNDTELVKAAEAGCPLCGLIQHCQHCQHCQHGRGTRMRYQIPVPNASSLEPPHFRIDTLRYKTSLYYIGEDGRYYVDLEIYSKSSASDIWASEDLGNTDPLDFGTVELINGWIKELLHVGPADGSQEPFLVENDSFIKNSQKSPITSEEKSSVLYATLSHCWGNTSHCIATKDTLSDKKACIPMSNLSRTYADAVTVTRAFGLKYLWIDSLCIIQDSVDDWERESAKMCWVYGSAYVTFAATSASDGDAGFLHARFIVDMSSMEATAGKLPMSCLVGDFWIKPDYGYGDSLGCGRLSERAWCYQEILLSPRILTFQANQISFSCRVKASKGYKRSPASLVLQKTARYFSRAVAQPPKDNDVRRRLFSTWRDIIQQYSSKNLTLQKDKLPALAGIAARFGEPTKCRYLAGIWEEDLLESLCWFLEGNFVSSEVEVYRAPSWSWASQLSGVGFRHASAISWDAEILECSTELVYDEYGQVRGGSIRLRATFIAGTLDLASVNGVVPRIMFFDTDEKTAPILCPIHRLDNQARDFEGTVQIWICFLGDKRVLVLKKLVGNLYRRIGYFYGWEDYDWSCGERIVVTII